MLSPVTEWQTHCSRCGAELPPEASYCAHCGQATEHKFAREPAPGIFQLTPANNIVVAFLVVAAVFAIAYRVEFGMGLSQTYATFVGLPLLIGVLTTYLTRPKSGLGATLKFTTVILCAVCPLLGEGAVCLLMAAPIFYAVAITGYFIVAGISQLVSPRGRSGMMSIIVLLPFLFGKATSKPTSIRNPRTIITSRTAIVAADPEKVWDTLLHRDDLVSDRLPFFLRLGFPRPTKLERSRDGTTRLTFDPGSEPWPGTNVIVSHQEVDAAHRRLIFIIEHDGTKLARWLTFVQTRFEVEPCAGGSRLRQVTTFRQRMQPGFYWNSLQRFAMGQMHRYALANVKRAAEMTEPTAQEAKDEK